MLSIFLCMCMCLLEFMGTTIMQVPMVARRPWSSWNWNNRIIVIYSIWVLETKPESSARKRGLLPLCVNVDNKNWWPGVFLSHCPPYIPRHGISSDPEIANSSRASQFAPWVLCLCCQSSVIIGELQTCPALTWVLYASHVGGSALPADQLPSPARSIFTL